MRGYSAADVVRLRGSLQPGTLAKNGAEKLWAKVNGGAKKGYVNAFGAITAGQAMQQAKAGLEAVYLSGWQVAADGNTSETMYPDQSLYAYDSVPTMVRRINNTFKRADEIPMGSRHQSGRQRNSSTTSCPSLPMREAGFGGVLNAFELMKNMITAGAAGVHEDQLAAVKKCGHMGGRCWCRLREAVEKLIAARFAADVMGVPTIVLARTDAEAANLLTSDCDARTTVPSSPASAPRKASTASRTVSNRPSAAAWRMHRMPTWFGAKPVCPTSASPANSRQAVRCMSGQAAVVQLLAFLQLEEEPRRQDRSPASRTTWLHWDTSTSSSPWPVSISTGTTPSSSRTPTPVAKA